MTPRKNSRVGVLVVLGGVVVDDVAEDQRVEEREDLIDRREDERERDERPIAAQIAGEKRHAMLGEGSHSDRRRVSAEGRSDDWNIRGWEDGTPDGTKCYLYGRVASETAFVADTYRYGQTAIAGYVTAVVYCASFGSPWSTPSSSQPSAGSVPFIP